MSYVKSYSTWTSTKKTAVDDAYSNEYLNYDQGYDVLNLSVFQNASTAFAKVSSPNWATTSDWAVLNIRSDTEFLNNTFALSQVARCIYAENTNIASGVRQQSMRAVAEVIMNRRDATGWPNTLEGVVLQAGQFSSMSDGNVGVTNPVLYNSDLDSWCYALFLANHLYSTIEPYGRQELSSNIYFFYDIAWSMPFYIYSGGTYTACTSSNVTSATHYRYGSSYYPITAGPIKIGTHIFFSW